MTDRVMGTDAAYAVGRFGEPSGYRAASAPGALVRATRAEAVEDQRAWLDSRHEVVVTGHTPNLLPGVSVMEKIRAADVFIVMDEMQYEAKGFCNRNRFSGGSWMVVPVAAEDHFKPFRQVRIADPTGRAREKVARTLEARMGERAFPYAVRMRERHEMLWCLTTSLLGCMIHDLAIETPWTWQSSLAAGRYDDVSEGLAAMVAEVGGTVWLSGPSGRNYLNESPFHARGIEVRYFAHEGPNPCALELLTKEARPHAQAA